MLKTLFNITMMCVLSALTMTLAAQEVWDANVPKYEERAVWLATIGGIDWPRTKATNPATTEAQKEELRRMLDQLQRANINVVILQTRIRGSVIYPSDIETWDEAITGRAGRAPSYDPLQFAIDECHQRGMELHAWMVCIPLGTASRQRSYGAQSVTRHHPSLCKTVGGEVFMIPGRAETADYIASIAREIATRYDVDGISLDYIRYPESQYRFSDDNLYTTSTGMTKAEWRRENITRIVRRVHDEVKAVKPWVKLSSSPIGKYRSLSRYASGGWDCYDAVYQDPQAWLRDNLQDMLFPMMYFQGNQFYPFLINWKENNYGHPVAAGLGIYFLDPREGRWQLDDVRAEMYAARQSGAGGIAFYRSEYLTRNFKGIYDAVTNELFTYPALTTPMTWMEQATQPASPSNLVAKGGTITWQGTGDASVRYNVYGSNQYPVDTDKAENLMAHHVAQTTIDITDRTKTRRYYAVTAINRYGIESQPLQEVARNDARHTYDEVMTAVGRHYSGASVAAMPATTGKASKAAKATKAEKTPKAAKAEKAAKPAKQKNQPKQEQQIITVDFSKYMDF